MSAFVVSDAHLNYMLNALVQYGADRWQGPPDSKELENLARELRAENNCSVNHRYEGRYPEDLGAEQPSPFRRAHVDPVTTLKAVQCYRYQASEHDGWERSRAAELCRQIESLAIAHLPGYDAAPWGIDEWQPMLPASRAFVPLADSILRELETFDTMEESDLRRAAAAVRRSVQRAQALFVGSR